MPDSLEENLEKIDELGGPTTFNHYAWGWTFAGNTPFRRWKRETYRGGISDPFIVHWPKGIKAKGEVRTQYAHAIDMVPTVLEALGIEAPTAIKGVTQSPIEGLSFAHAFDDAKAPIEAHHPVLRDDGPSLDLPRRLARGLPVAGAIVHGSGHAFGAPIDAEKLTELDAKGWELYHIEQGLRREPQRRRREPRQADRDDRARGMSRPASTTCCRSTVAGTMRLADPRPQIAVDRTSYTYYPGTQMVPSNAGPNVLNRPHSITADVDIPNGGAEGVLLSAGDVQGGFAFYVQDGKLQYVYNYVRQRASSTCESNVAGSGGRHKLRFEFEVTGKPDITHGKGAPGRGQLYIDGKLVGQADIPLTMPLTIGLAGGMVCGADTGSPVWDKYQPPFKFTGTLYSVTVDVSGDLIKDTEAEMRMVMARQ